MQPIVVHLTPVGPNSWKVIVLLEELRLPYTVNSFSFQNIKEQPFISVNPNGRVPAIEDPNTNLTLWESGAILHYLITQYDSKRSVSHDSVVDRAHEMQWLMFQMSGQGPYFGQAAWFSSLHPEKVPSAIERYNSELRRHLGVLETHLESGRTWLVGDKMTYADIAFAPWNERIDSVLFCAPENKFDGFPNVAAWHQRITSRPSWIKAMKLRAKLMDEQGLQPNGLPKGFANHAEYLAHVQKQSLTQAQS